MLTITFCMFFIEGTVKKAYALDYYVADHPAVFSNGYDAWYSNTHAKAYADIMEAEGYCFTQIYARVYNYVDGAWQFEESYDALREINNSWSTGEIWPDCTLTMLYPMVAGQRCQVQYWGKCYGITKFKQDFFVK